MPLTKTGKIAILIVVIIIIIIIVAVVAKPPPAKPSPAAPPAATTPSPVGATTTPPAPVPVYLQMGSGYPAGGSANCFDLGQVGGSNVNKCTSGNDWQKFYWKSGGPIKSALNGKCLDTWGSADPNYNWTFADCSGHKNQNFVANQNLIASEALGGNECINFGRPSLHESCQQGNSWQIADIKTSI